MLIVSRRVLLRILRAADRRIAAPQPRFLSFTFRRSDVATRLLPHEQRQKAMGDPVSLIVRFEDARATSDSRDEATYYRRRLTVEALRRALRRDAMQRSLDAATCESLRETLGPFDWECVKEVLRDSGYATSRSSDRQIAETFLCRYAELMLFDQAKLSTWFPELELDAALLEGWFGAPIAAFRAASEQQLAALGVDASAFESEVPSESRNPAPSTPQVGAAHDAAPAARGALHAPSASPERQTEAPARGARAQARLQRGNYVGAAIAAHRTAPDLFSRAIGWLADGLLELGRVAADQREQERQRWTEDLRVLVTHSRGRFRAEERVLYDLQRALLDAREREIRVDVVDWAISLGRRPMRRELPHQAVLRPLRHVDAALKKLPRTAIPGRVAASLRRSVGALARALERRLDETVRPVLDRAFDAVSLGPSSIAETAARDALVSELLDEVRRRGFFSLSRLRDALSRNLLKLDDLRSPLELMRGDALLRLDRELTRAMPGLYRRGEFYLRLLQRVSSLFFATVPGRLLTRYAVLPLAGAFVIVEFSQYLANLIIRPFVGHKIVLTHAATLLAATLFVFGLMHSEGFRHGALLVVRAIGRALRTVLIDLPLRIARHPAVIRFLSLPFIRMIGRHVAIPALVGAGPATLLVLSARMSPTAIVLASVVSFLTFERLINSPIGIELRERAADSIARQWRFLRYRLLPGLVGFVLQLFERLLNGLERWLYRVDIWLRFRRSEHPAMLPVKAVLGVVWFFATYLVRVYINLLIEPQVNPIKHFPVVTVSHKMVLPFTITLTRLLQKPLAPLGPFLSQTIAATTILLLPGVFGFLVWELKENWKLYSANRHRELEPVAFGDHGETMTRLLVPGFHSGTIPKQYSKLRHRSGADVSEHSRPREALRHVEEALERFLVRRLFRLLELSPRWRIAAPQLAGIRLAPNQVVVDLRFRLDDGGERAAQLIFGELRRNLALQQTPAIPALPADHAELWQTALDGLAAQTAVCWRIDRVAALVAPSQVVFDGATLELRAADAHARFVVEPAETLRALESPVCDDAPKQALAAEDRTPAVEDRSPTTPSSSLTSASRLADALFAARAPVLARDWFERWQTFR
ncbi:MAG: hypothetical protein KC609_23020 [Myxococcales bacterium]|nr:hypothetical protein [Myxococcales bacterium]